MREPTPLRHVARPDGRHMIQAHDGQDWSDVAEAATADDARFFAAAGEMFSTLTEVLNYLELRGSLQMCDRIRETLRRALPLTDQVEEEAAIAAVTPEKVVGYITQGGGW